jgi:nucleotide-binding universal stress UspA family protein
MHSKTEHYGIIVGIDGSSASDAAVSWAANNAAMRGVPLTLMHVENPSAPTWSQLPVLEQLKEQQRAEARTMLANASKIAHDAISDDAKIRIEGELLSSATVPTLVDRSGNADMVVVGTDGRGALARGLLGSVSSGLLRHAHCPVAVIHEETTAIPHNAPVLVGIDGSKGSELATKIAFEEASNRRTGLVALHAWSDRELLELPGIPWPEVEAEEKRLLFEALAGWEERYPDVAVTKQLVGDRPSRALLDASLSAQLVVVGSRGRNVLIHSILGSVSNAVVQSMRVPVIVARHSD